MLLFDTLEESRVLSLVERQVRSLCQDRLHLAIKERAAVWRQRGKRQAVQEGDSNMAFFHAHTTQRLRRNAIRGIEVDGVMVTSHTQKMQALTAYYKHILGTTSDPVWHFDVSELYHGRVRASDALTAEFTEAEAWSAVRSMNGGSAPGPDGFGPSFYRAAWNTVKP